MRHIYRPPVVMEAWFELLPQRQQAHARRLLDLLMQAQPDLMPVVKWGALVFLSGPFHAFAIAPCRRAVHLQVFNGGMITQRFPMLGGNGPGMRALNLRYSDALDEDLISRVIAASIAAGRRRERRFIPETPDL